MAAAAVATVAAAVVVVALSGNAGHLTLASGKSPTAAAPATRTDPAAAGTPTGQRTATRDRSPATAGATTEPAAPATTSPAPPARTTSPQATLSVSVRGSAVPVQPGGQLMIGPFGTWLTLIANGGPVSWSITASSGISVWPQASGTLTTARPSTSVLIAAGRKTSGATLTINPGGASYQLVISSRF